MKSQHTPQALDELRAVCGDRVPVVCCQNGVTNERLALRRIHSVYAMCVFLPSQHLEPGRIQSHARSISGVLDIGLYPHGADDRAAEICDLLERSNFSSRPDPAVMRYKYAKLLMNLGNGIDAIVPAGADADRIIEIIREEGRTCYTAAGIDWASVEEVRERIADLQMVEIEGVERVGGSSRQSLMRATGDIEIDYLNGEIALLGRLHGVPTPANTVVQRLAKDLARQKGPSRSIAADQVMQLIEDESSRGDPLT
jgi:2-dehydropantoate 2-reductase